MWKVWVRIPPSILLENIMNKTTLWHVYFCAGIPHKVIVADHEIDNIRFNHRMRIRTISPNAAGRSYVRNNLARRIAEMWEEDKNPLAWDGVTEDMVKKYRSEEKNAEIEVVKKFHRPRQKNADRHSRNRRRS